MIFAHCSEEHTTDTPLALVLSLEVLTDYYERLEKLFYWSSSATLFSLLVSEYCTIWRVSVKDRPAESEDCDG